MVQLINVWVWWWKFGLFTLAGHEGAEVFILKNQSDPIQKCFGGGGEIVFPITYADSGYDGGIQSNEFHIIVGWEVALGHDADASFFLQGEKCSHSLRCERQY